MAQNQPKGNNPNRKKRPAKKQSLANRTGLIIGICAAVSILLIVVIICSIVGMVNRNRDDGRILNNVYAAGVNLGGMTVDEAKSALHLATDSTFSVMDMVVQLPDAEIRISPSQTGARLDVDAVVAEAYAYGRTGSEEERAAVRQAANNNIRTIALLPYLNLNLNHVRTAIDEFCDSYSSVMTQPKVELVGKRPVYEVPDPNFPDVPVAPVTHQTLKITMGTPNYILNPDTLYNRVLDAYSLNELTFKYQAPALTEPQKPVAADIFAQHYSWPKDAILDEVTYEVTPEEYGYGFDIEKLQALIDKADYGQVIELKMNFIMPQVTAMDLTKDLFLDMIASNITSSDLGDAWNNNLKVSCEAINGVVIKVGEEFSFNNLMGRPNADKGYKRAPGYRNGKDASVMGSGVSQTASTLYYCLLKADLEVLERHASNYAPNYADIGLDAFIIWGEKDLRFRNNTNSPIRIFATAEGGTVTIQLFGVDEKDYDVQLTTQTTAQYDPSTVYQLMDKNNILGYANGHVLQSGITGYDVTSVMVKYDKLTGVQISSSPITHSKYSSRDQIVVKFGQSMPSVPPTEPDEPTTPSTPDPSTPPVPEV